MILEIIIVILAAYLIGSIPTGYIIVKLFTGQDIRTIGSGSTGATNVKRVMGKKWFFIVMILDAIKGALPVILAKIFTTAFAGIGLLPVLAAVAVIWAVITYVSKYVSLGSIIALFISPFLMWFFDAPAAYIVYCALGAVYIIYLHRENIKRLIRGEENKVR